MISRCSSKQFGFTLIELLVVLTISMTAIGLVGGLSIDFIEKYKIQAEIKILSRTLKKAADLAFIIEQPIEVDLQQSTLILNDNDKKLSVHSFKYISFTSQKFSYSQLGQPSTGVIEFRINNQQDKAFSLWSYK